MRRVGGITGRSLQFLGRSCERGLRAFSPSAIFLRIERKSFDGHSQAAGNEVTGEETAEQKDRACAPDLPAQVVKLRHGTG